MLKINGDKIYFGMDHVATIDESKTSAAQRFKEFILGEDAYKKGYQNGYERGRKESDVYES